MMDLEITIFDANGNVLSQNVAQANTATQEQVDEMIALIEGGCPAWLAAEMVCPLERQRS